MPKFILISVTRDELEICESFHDSHEKAHNAMIEDIKISCNFETQGEIDEAVMEGHGDLQFDEAWFETSQFGTGQWKIVEIPGAAESVNTGSSVQKFNYTGKLLLTNPKRVPFSLSNEFDDSFVLEEEVMGCADAEAFCHIARKHHMYNAVMTIESDNDKFTRLSFKDGMGNIHYLIAYKEAN